MTSAPIHALHEILLLELCKISSLIHCLSEDITLVERLINKETEIMNSKQTFVLNVENRDKQGVFVKH